MCININLFTESDVYTCIYKYIAETDATGSVNVVEHSLK